MTRHQEEDWSQCACVPQLILKRALKILQWHHLNNGQILHLCDDIMFPQGVTDSKNGSDGEEEVRRGPWFWFPGASPLFRVDVIKILVLRNSHLRSFFRECLSSRVSQTARGQRSHLQMPRSYPVGGLGSVGGGMYSIKTFLLVALRRRAAPLKDVRTVTVAPPRRA